MAQQFLHHFELCTDASQQSRECVPEGMPSKSFLNPDALRNWANVLA
jgi:hypothetical protein